MPTKASSPTKNKGKAFFVAKSSGPLLGRLPLKLIGGLKYIITIYIEQFILLGKMQAKFRINTDYLPDFTVL